jgi:ABC-type polysaccharide/polyol phosphate export permease
MERLTIYRPNDRANQSLIGSVVGLLKEAFHWRRHIWTQFARDFVTPFQRAGLGPVWAILLPLTPVGAYSFLLIVLRSGGQAELHPAVIVTFGVTFWFLFSDCVTSVISTIQTKARAVSKTAFPLFGTVIGQLGQTFFDFGIRIVACMVVLIWLGGPPSVSTALVPVCMIVALPFFIGLGLILGVFNAVNHDVGMLTSVFARYGLFVSSAIFPIASVAPPDITFLATTFNPFAFFIEVCRALIVGPALPLPDHWQISLTVYAVLSVCVFLIGARLFHVAEYELRGDA